MYSKDIRDNASALTPEIARFETWLRSHGYQPARDPFVPVHAGFDEIDDATDLVGEYLHERPYERMNRELLLDHAYEIGAIAPIWGDSGYAVMP
jgi:hypothetical protein